MDGRRSGLVPDALLVSLPDIDVQHEQIFAFLETLKIACFGSSYLPEDGFRRFINDLAQHFADEERLASFNGVDFSQHALVHQDNLRAMRGALESVLSGASDAYSFLRYTEFWFERHIVQFDKPFVVELKAKGEVRSFSGSNDSAII